MRLLAKLIVACTVSLQIASAQSPTPVEEHPSLLKQLKKESQFQSSAQAGVEYDSNIFKTFGQAQADTLLRVLLKSSAIFQLTDYQKLPIRARLGGKKFFQDEEQDLMIGELDAGWRYGKMLPLKIGTDLRFKAQIENSERDAAGTDINENFVSIIAHFFYEHPLPAGFQARGFVSHREFYFGEDRDFDFRAEELGLQVTAPRMGGIDPLLRYSYLNQNFTEEDDRTDRQHEISVLGRYYRFIYLSLGYTFQKTRSSDAVFHNTNHRVNLLFSLPLSFWGGRADDMTLNFLGTLQIRRYPSVSITNEEGERIVLTQGEEDNFNSLVVKLTKRLTNHFTAEFKFSRYTNEFSTQEDPFSRNLFMFGLRGEL